MGYIRYILPIYQYGSLNASERGNCCFAAVPNDTMNCVVHTDRYVAARLVSSGTMRYGREVRFGLVLVEWS
jgi:hypothetical protein